MYILVGCESGFEMKGKKISVAKQSSPDQAHGPQSGSLIMISREASLIMTCRVTSDPNLSRFSWGLGPNVLEMETRKGS